MQHVPVAFVCGSDCASCSCALLENFYVVAPSYKSDTSNIYLRMRKNDDIDFLDEFLDAFRKFVSQRIEENA